MGKEGKGIVCQLTGARFGEAGVGKTYIFDLLNGKIRVCRNTGLLRLYVDDD